MPEGLMQAKYGIENKKYDYIVYLTTNLVNGRKYVGHDSFNRPGYLGSGVFLKQAIVKYGRHNFTKEILEYCNSKKEMIDRERHWIEVLNAVNDPMFYNISYKTGGMGVGDKHREETLKLISERSRGNKLTPEQRKKLSENQMGRVPHNKGKSFDKNSEEYKKTYGTRKSSKPADLDTMKSVIKDYELGIALCDIGKKHNRIIRQCQIKRFYDKLKES